MSPAPGQASSLSSHALTPALLVVLGLGLGLALCEVTLRLFIPQVTRQPSVWGYDAQLGWSHIPGASGRMMSPEFDVDVSINADGLRDREYDPVKGPDVRRVLVFGDSFAEGWGVPIDRSVSEKLEMELAWQVGAGAYEVLNFGVAGFGTDQELLLFRQHGVRYSADDVVVLFYANDLWNNQSRQGIGTERGHKPYFRISGAGKLVLRGVPVKKNRYWDWQEGVWNPPGSQRLGRYLYTHWHIIALMAKALSPSPLPTAQQARYYEGLYGRDETAAGAGWRLVEAILAEFQQAAVAAGARMHLVYIPAIVQVEEDDWRLKQQLHGLAGEDFDLTRPNRLLRAIAARNKIPFLDLTQRFVAEGRSRTLYYRDSHWNEAGHALAAKVISEHLRRHVKAGNLLTP